MCAGKGLGWRTVGAKRKGNLHAAVSGARSMPRAWGPGLWGRVCRATSLLGGAGRPGCKVGCAHEARPPRGRRYGFAGAGFKIPPGLWRVGRFGDK